MKTVSTHPGSGSELRALLSFYGATLVGMIVLHTLALGLLPAAWFAEHDLFIWTLSFAISCGCCSWLFERHQRRIARG